MSYYCEDGDPKLSKRVTDGTVGEGGWCSGAGDC